ncbi:hypothetical protein ACNAW0_26190 [Micromonospora sp. SL1-18]|uniref:hypothetical protein n=1 Tax=Micromonospora sp. SL1-18 TaxID=3399128 RepID=UPI003A4DB461
MLHRAVVDQVDVEHVTNLAVQDRAGRGPVVRPPDLLDAGRDLHLLLLNVQGDVVRRAALRGLERRVDRLPVGGRLGAGVDRRIVAAAGAARGAARCDLRLLTLDVDREQHARVLVT